MSQCASKPEDWAGHPGIIYIVSSNTSIQRSHACYLKQYSDFYKLKNNLKLTYTPNNNGKLIQTQVN